MQDLVVISTCERWKEHSLQLITHLGDDGAGIWYMLANNNVIISREHRISFDNSG